MKFDLHLKYLAFVSKCMNFKPLYNALYSIKTAIETYSVLKVTNFSRKFENSLTSTFNLLTIQFQIVHRQKTRRILSKICIFTLLSLIIFAHYIYFNSVSISAQLRKIKVFALKTL